MCNKIYYLLIFLISCTSMQSRKNDIALPFDQPPQWSKEAIWYQIFVERFRNGNPNNNPTRATCEGALHDDMPLDWEITPWGHNWYKQEKWAESTGLDFYRTIQMRRYGGDLDGVEQKIAYFKELGINAIYFNPLNDAPSLHKYDARHYHHIDITFGDNAEDDLKIIALEDPADPTTWQWTSADKKFISLVKKLHSEGIKVVLDFSWNHTGREFWAFKDIRKNKTQSNFKDWYDVKFSKNEITDETIMEYEGWYGIASLPELKKINSTGKKEGHPYEGNLQEEVKAHIFAVCQRWMDPNGDGNFEDGIDGMRLDVAEHVPIGFWQDFRKHVRKINPNFYLVGENWWEDWPDKLMDPRPWIKGDIFDAVMHYQWFKVARGYFATPDDRLNLQEFTEAIDSIYSMYPTYTQQAMMNLAASHDSPRLLTSLANANKYKYLCKPKENPHYRTDLPDQEVYHKHRQFLLHQFTFVGAPHIWNGDEMGMTGADDPDCRKPLVWPDIVFENETASSFSQYSYDQQPRFDYSTFNYYKSLITLRKSSPAFVYGEYKFLNFVNTKNILAYTRSYNHETFIVIFNNNIEHQEIQIPDNIKIYDKVFEYGTTKVQGSEKIILPPYSAIVVKTNNFI